MKNSEETKVYHRQMIEMAEESKKLIKVSADQILKEADDEKLGRWVRMEMLKKIRDCDAHIEHVKSLQ
jgi:hypothetical protein